MAFKDMLDGAAATLGGIGLLGKTDYDAFQAWKADQGAAAESGAAPEGELTGSAAERRSEALLKAMIAAAKADGHIDPTERDSIKHAIRHLGLDEKVQSMMEAELERPLSPTDVVAAADSPEAAAEMYLASLFVIDTQDSAERMYLNDLPAGLAALAGTDRASAYAAPYASRAAVRGAWVRWLVAEIRTAAVAAACLALVPASAWTMRPGVVAGAA